ncbi:MAG TPA: alpha-amylase [Planctomycetes bacterium]|nr:alpha-amylase [Planctomycetota bacterium]
MNPYFASQVMRRLAGRFRRLYGDEAERCLARLAMLVGRYGIEADLAAEPRPPWDHRTALIITYGDMLHGPAEKPLATLKRFLDTHLAGLVSHVHLLPFFPYSSDDGFSVIHYRKVNPDLGSWQDVEALGERFGLAADLVLNHVSRQSKWFGDYAHGIAPARHYFIEADPAADLGAVARPRSSPLLTQVATRGGPRYVWTTFSADQIDLNYANPDVLFEILDILLLYISKGARIIRLDAVAYLWKKPGTRCLHLPETHEIVKVLRDVLALVAPHVLLLTETNVPHAENVSYFGEGDEAHMVYQFALPPLILHAFLSGSTEALRAWGAGLADPPPGCTVLNFTASHDGIGLRPIEGLIDEAALAWLIARIQDSGGRVSMGKGPGGALRPYEINATWLDALNGAERPADVQCRRFLSSQAVMLGLRGVPAIYFNSLFGARNDHALAEKTGLARSLNRTKWDVATLERLINDPLACERLIWEGYRGLLRVRAAHPAFHPDGRQTFLDAGDGVLAFTREAPSGDERMLCATNVGAVERGLGAELLAGCGLAPGSGADCIADMPLQWRGDALVLEPFQTLWIALP